jgi:hypothetical protein
VARHVSASRIASSRDAVSPLDWLRRSTTTLSAAPWDPEVTASAAARGWTGRGLARHGTDHGTEHGDDQRGRRPEEAAKARQGAHVVAAHVATSRHGRTARKARHRNAAGTVPARCRNGAAGVVAPGRARA